MRQLIWVAFLFLLLMGCSTSSNKVVSSRDFTEIKASGVLKVITDYNSTNYFFYKGVEMGFQFELISEFARVNGLKLELKVSNDMEANKKQLVDGQVDLIASNLFETKEDERITYSEAQYFARTVLVQRKSNGNSKGGTVSFSPMIRNKTDLKQKTIFVPERSVYGSQVEVLSKEIGDTIHIVKVADYEVEQLISLVATGEISYTICEENVGKVNRSYYPEIDISTPIGGMQKVAWAFAKDSKELQKNINAWLVGFKKTLKYQMLYKRYFENSRVVKVNKHEGEWVINGRLSQYDAIMKSEAKKENIDWRLVASIVYQESQFKPEAESWAGAVGLMQLMPETIRNFDVLRPLEPQENISGGVRLLKWLDSRFLPRVPNAKERIKFVLASYNVGIGHVLDAMALAQKHGKNGQVWHGSVDNFLLNKSMPEYYTDSVVKFGYCRGEEPYYYVIEVLDRYDLYCQLLD